MASKIEMQRMLVEELNGQGYEAVEFPWEDEKADPSLAAELAQSLVSKNLSLGADFAIGKGVQLIDAEVTRLRYRLTTAEVERLRVLGKDSGEAIGRMARALVPGLTESEVARRANDALAEIDARAVVNLVAADERIAKYRHPVPKDHAWRNVLMVVVCARRAGLIVSLTRLVCAGKSSEDLSRRTQASASVNAQLFAATRLGVAGSELYEVAARAYREAGFAGEEKLHHQGGATGYRTRDWVAHPHCGERVLERQAFAWNPSVTGAKVEETCIAFADGVEVVTTTPGWPMIAV
ncbi:MAG: M24 family metallopeptidase, partial [Gammaproteobacteria bacterium]